MRKRLLLIIFAGSLMLSGQDFNKASFFFGGGPTVPLKDTGERLGTGFNILAGGGIKMSPNFSLDLTYSYNQADYDGPVPPDPTFQPLEGTAKLHGFTLNPTVHLNPGGPVGGYITGGYGVYNRRFQITTETIQGGWYCDPWWGWCVPGYYPVDVLLRDFSTWKGGFNVGGGVTFGSSAKFFADVRYHYIFTPNIRTEILPFSFGIRF
jgi:opacity protein-like surface antigen